jgi:hypothetical protein
MKEESIIQTINQVITELLEMTKLTAHEKSPNNEIAVHLGEAEQKRMCRTMRELLADELEFVLNLEVSSACSRKGGSIANFHHRAQFHSGCFRCRDYVQRHLYPIS